VSRLFLGTLFILFLAFDASCAIGAPDLRGAMIGRIATFVEWPSCSKASITIGVYDDDESFERFRKLYQNQTIFGRPIVVKALNDISKLDVLTNCDILCIGSLSSQERSKVLQKLAKNSILVVGNSRDDAKAGVAIVLLEEGHRYRILVNQEALKNANLRADYRLLKLAELVEGN
jgi:hypothetical protein